MKQEIRNMTRRLLVLSAAVLLPFCRVCAVIISDGSTNYSLTAQALSHMTEEVVLTMGYVVGLLYAVASLLAIYNATIVLPAFFGYQVGNGGYSPFG